MYALFEAVKFIASNNLSDKKIWFKKIISEFYNLTRQS